MPLIMLRDAIVTAWEAAQPPAYDSRRYRHVLKAGNGASFHRAFWFGVPRGGEQRSQDSTRFGADLEMQAIVALHIPERTTFELEWPYREWQVLAPLVKAIRIARVMAPMIVHFEPVEAEEPDDYDLILTITCRTKEQG